MRIISICLATLLVSCSAGVEENRSDTEDATGKKKFTVALQIPEANQLQLTDAKLDVIEVAGSFVGCDDDDWKIEGAKGEIVASMKCKEIVYKSLTMKVGEVTGGLTLDGQETVKDAAGNIWSFKSVNGVPTLIARNVTTGGGEIILGGGSKPYEVELAVDPGVGPICDAEAPFLLKASGSRIYVTLNQGSGHAVKGIDLLINKKNLGKGLPLPTINKKNTRFTLDFTGKTAGVYEYSNVLLARKGGSSCVMKSLKVELKSDMPGGACNNEYLHNEIFIQAQRVTKGLPNQFGLVFRKLIGRLKLQDTYDVAYLERMEDALTVDPKAKIDEAFVESMFTTTKGVTSISHALGHPNQSEGMFLISAGNIDIAHLGGHEKQKPCVIIGLANVEISHLRSCLVIAKKKVDLAHTRDSHIIAASEIDISHLNNSKLIAKGTDKRITGRLTDLVNRCKK